MNPTSNETAGLNLPPPVAETLSPGAAAVESNPSQPEQAPVAMEQGAGVAQPSVPVLPTTSVPLPTNPIVTSSPSDDATSTSLTTPVTPSKNSSLEKELVNRAKRIVEQTKDDPYRQSEELTTVKAEYMRQNYNKIIKTK